jgi:2-polyprenyl-3-methyl-5-hydroxy-6-metoxy-1,4-benzoquinol methylase
VHWWAVRFLRPRVRHIFGTIDPGDFYLTPIAERISSAARRLLVCSLGSGDGEVECELARRLQTKGLTNVRIVGVELFDTLVARSRARAEAAGLSHMVEFVEGNLNDLHLPDSVDVIICNQILHHVTELESLFAEARRALHPDGVLLTRDMIGKNGHQAWPEALAVVERLWNHLPAGKKYHHRHKKHVETYANADHASAGFEGIRSQDVMRCLLNEFHATHFYSFGGIVERFINRGYGANYSTESDEDKSFVVALQELNDALIDGGIITPTQMVGRFVPKATACIHWKQRTPERSMRSPS